jgi:hypothetical protein
LLSAAASTQYELPIETVQSQQHIKPHQPLFQSASPHFTPAPAVPIFYPTAPYQASHIHEQPSMLHTFEPASFSVSTSPSQTESRSFPISSTSLFPHTTPCIHQHEHRRHYNNFTHSNSHHHVPTYLHIHPSSQSESESQSQSQSQSRSSLSSSTFGRNHTTTNTSALDPNPAPAPPLSIEQLDAQFDSNSTYVVSEHDLITDNAHIVQTGDFLFDAVRQQYVQVQQIHYSNPT